MKTNYGCGIFGFIRSNKKNGRIGGCKIIVIELKSLMIFQAFLTKNAF